jgi:hypothetical protein
VATYQFSFGEVNVTEGMPVLSADLQAWVEAEAAARIPAVLQQILREAVHKALVPVAAAAAPLVVSAGDGALTGGPPAYERRSSERVQASVEALFWPAEKRQAWNEEQAKFRRPPQAPMSMAAIVDEDGESVLVGTDAQAAAEFAPEPVS